VSERNVELHRRINEAFSAGDLEGWLALADPSIECRSAFALGGVYQGHEGIRMWFADLREAWGGELRLEPEAYFDLGDDTLCFNVVRGRGRHSELEVTMKTAQVLGWREGLCVFVKGYLDRDDALKDLGLAADALEPLAP
jgi:ketosteroid isomerase-like protein